MNLWLVIVSAILVTVALRVIPVIVTKKEFSKPQWLLDFLDYAACAAIGGMIYMSAFYHLNEPVEFSRKIALFVCNALILLIAFFLSIKLKKPVVVFMISLSVYFIMCSVIFVV